MNDLYNINRRKFLGLFGCCACGFIIPSCSTVPITERKQLKLLPESSINRQAAQLYERVKSKVTLSNDTEQLNEIKEIGAKIEESVSAYFDSINKKDPTYNYQWEYILVENKKIKNAWCMPGGKIAVYTGILENTKNKHGLAAVMGHEIAPPVKISIAAVPTLNIKALLALSIECFATACAISCPITAAKPFLFFVISNIPV